MPDRSYLDWPFLEPRHRALAADLEDWCGQHLATVDHADADAACRGLVTALGTGGWLTHCAPDPEDSAAPLPDVRSLCLIRETLARYDALADFAFAMQGLGSGPISLFGTPEQKRRWLPGVRKGKLIAAFALSEPDAGSDVAAIRTSARRESGQWILDGSKTWISNGGIADFYVVFARSGEAPGTRGLSAFLVEAGTPGLHIRERIHTLSPHPLATLEFRACAVPADQLLGNPGEGFKVAMATLDIFRSTVGAAALGFARRALDETAAHCRTRHLFGAPLADLQMTRATLAEMALEIDASALLVYRAAWTRDCRAQRVTREAAMAKLYATEAAQSVVDRAVQLFGARGVVRGETVEHLYREVRALRIYEGASEVQKLIIARQLLEG